MRWPLPVALLTCLLLSHAVGLQGTAEQQPGRHVVLVSIDGFAAFHLDDPAIDLPHIRALAAAGARATASETVFPSLTHPAHTTLITGVTPRHHGVVHNRVRDRVTGARQHITNLPRRESVLVPTLFDAAKAKGLRTAAFFWPETKDDGSIDDNIGEVFDAREMADPATVDPALLAELRNAGVPIDTFFAFYDDPFAQGVADQALTKAAIHVLKTRRPALTALHLLVADKVQHEFGAAHYLSRAALTTADHCVGLLRKAVEDAGLAERTTFVVAADHGFATVEQELNLAPLLADPVLDGHVRWHEDNWYVFAELLPSFDAQAHGPALKRVLAKVERTAGVARVVRPGQFATLGYPEYSDNRFVPGHYLIAGQPDTHLTLDTKTAGAGRRSMRSAYHGHGYFPDHPSMKALLVLSGAGIKPGVSLGATRNVDVAPTIAALLGLSLEQAEGRVLRDALSAQ